MQQWQNVSFTSFKMLALSKCLPWLPPQISFLSGARIAAESWISVFAATRVVIHTTTENKQNLYFCVTCDFFPACVCSACCTYCVHAVILILKGLKSRESVFGICFFVTYASNAKRCYLLENWNTSDCAGGEVISHPIWEEHWLIWFVGISLPLRKSSHGWFALPYLAPRRG